MNSIMIYAYLEWKKSWNLIKKMLISVGLLLLLGTVGVTFATFALAKANVLSKIRVAIFVPEEERQTQMVVQFASTLDSVQSICEFVAYDAEEQALSDLKNGTVQACVVFPDHFYEDADQGINTPATVYVPDDPDLSQRLFRRMLRDGVGLLQTSEAGVYAVFDLTEQYPVGWSSEEIGDFMLDLYITQLFDGSRIFRETVVSPLDVYSLPEFMFGGLLLLCMFLPGVCFGTFYRPKQRALEQKLLILGINAWKLSLIRVCIMGQMLWLCFACVYMAGCLFSYFGGFTIVCWDAGVLMGALLICVALACVFHGIYACSGNERTGTIAVLLLEVWMIIGSGMLIPLDYLPEFMQRLCREIRLEVWSSSLLSLLYYGFDREQACIMCIYALGMFSLGVFGLWKHTSSGWESS